MQRPFVLLNLSRGGDSSANKPVQGPQEREDKGRSAGCMGAGTGVEMKGEQQKEYKELITMPNFIGTPHIAGYTVQALYKMKAISWPKNKQNGGERDFGK